MGMFLRQIIALSALWALSELLMPEGGISSMARLVISLLVMAVLMTSAIDALNGWAGVEVSVTQSLGAAALESAEEMQQRTEAGYAQAYLRSLANQAEDTCVRMAKGAGYAADTAVYLRDDGSLERIDLRVRHPLYGGTQPLISAEDLRQRIAEAFMADLSCVKLIPVEWSHGVINEGEGESD